MNAEIINPFVAAAFTFFEKEYKTKITQGSLSPVQSPFPGKDVNVVIGLSGSLRGQVIFCLSLETARQIASLMLYGYGMPVDDFDEIAKSAISEMGNIIAGNAATSLNQAGLSCIITPPSLLLGQEISFSFKDLQILVVPLNMDVGEITILVAIKNTENPV